MRDSVESFLAAVDSYSDVTVGKNGVHYVTEERSNKQEALREFKYPDTACTCVRARLQCVCEKIYMYVHVSVCHCA